MQGKIETRVGFFVLAAIGIFCYMGFQIGTFRFDTAHYTSYIIQFKDISGLYRKADVKIAGVKVGWVEHVSLLMQSDIHAQATIMISKEYILHANAYALIRQDGWLGPKYIELIPGDPRLQSLNPGSMIGQQQGEQFSMNDALQQFIEIGSAVKKISEKIEYDVLPSFQQSIDRISHIFDRDFNRVADVLTQSVRSIETATTQAQEGLCCITSVAQKLDEGEGSLGKLINDDETYNTIHCAVSSLKQYMNIVNQLTITFDAHTESMCRQAENYLYEDLKGYFDMRVYPSDDHFYMLQIVGSEKGFLNRKEIHRIYSDKTPDWKHAPDNIDTYLYDVNFRRFEDLFRLEKTTIDRNSWRIGLQFGKIFRNFTFRFGLFEGFGGCACDFDIPFPTNKAQWITTFEAFDWRGWNRLNDKRPHLKWLNRIFLLHNMYLTFGADDFISKNNASVFFGLGLRFGDGSMTDESSKLF